MQKSILIGFFFTLMTFSTTSCSKSNNYCYDCSASNRYTGAIITEQECDLSKGDRDGKADAFVSNHVDLNGWSTSCSRTSK